MMTIAMARLTVRTYLDRMGRFDPEEAHDLQQAITLLIEDAVARALEPPAPRAPEVDRRAEDQP